MRQCAFECPKMCTLPVSLAERSLLRMELFCFHPEDPAVWVPSEQHMSHLFWAHFHCTTDLHKSQARASSARSAEATTAESSVTTCACIYRSVALSDVGSIDQMVISLTEHATNDHLLDVSHKMRRTFLVEFGNQRIVPHNVFMHD